MDKTSADVIKKAGYCLYPGQGSSQFKLLEDVDRRTKPTGDAEDRERGREVGKIPEALVLANPVPLRTTSPPAVRRLR